MLVRSAVTTSKYDSQHQELRGSKVHVTENSLLQKPNL
jgi:hypothetical protein